MQGKSSAEKWNMCFNLVLWLVLCSVAMVLMLWVSATKKIVIADGGAATLWEEQDREFQPDSVRKRRLELESLEGAEKVFSITLPQDVEAEDIVMENHYTIGELWIRVHSQSRTFYGDCYVSGDVSGIVEGTVGEQTKGIWLKLKMVDLFEYESTLEGNNLVVSYDSPGAVYERIILLDPMGGGEETGLTLEGTEAVYEKDVALQVARKVQKMFSMEGVRVYLTRMDDSAMSMEERLELVKATEADLYIRIGAAADEQPECYGISSYYNDAYYRPGFGNVELADILTREVTIAVDNRALGVFPAGEGSILRSLEIPAAQLSVGYLSNEQELALLTRDSYQEKLAGGIGNAITKACERLSEAEKAEEAEALDKEDSGKEFSQKETTTKESKKEK